MAEILIRVSATMTDKELKHFKSKIVKVLSKIDKLCFAEMIVTNDVNDVKIIKIKK